MSRNSANFSRVALFAGLLGFAPAAFAYLDPSTGSMILSAIIGVFATVGLAVKTYWYKLKSVFSGDKSKSGKGSIDPDGRDLTSEQQSD